MVSSSFQKIMKAAEGGFSGSSRHILLTNTAEYVPKLLLVKMVCFLKACRLNLRVPIYTYMEDGTLSTHF